MLQNLINILKARAADLEAHLGKDLSVVEADAQEALETVEARLQALLAKLKNL